MSNSYITIYYIFIVRNKKIFYFKQEYYIYKPTESVHKQNIAPKDAFFSFNSVFAYIWTFVLTNAFKALVCGYEARV